MRYAKNFRQLSKSDTAIAGGKGASLGEMTRLFGGRARSNPVPPGFVVLASAFDGFLHEAALDSRIKAELKKVKPKAAASVDRASKKIQSMILKAEFPKDLARDISKEFAKLKAPLVAVRSSATAEDSLVASWAGELESYLNTTKNNLLENVKHCWASLFSVRAIVYRFEKKLQKTPVSVAVVVQAMIQSEISGITFTVHPVTEDRDQMVIEAGYGLGEAIVGGKITPDTYIISKAQITKPKQIILDKNISEQKMMIVKSKNGAAEMAVPRALQTKQKLSDKQVITLAKICHKIENHYGFPCDIEWALKKGKFYIVQSRPITTLTNNKNKKRILKKFFNRYMPIYAAQYSYIGKSEVLLKILDNAANFPPLFVNRPGKGAAVYYEAELYETNSKKTLEYFRKNPAAMKKITEDYKKIYHENIDFIENAKVSDIKKLFDLNAYQITPLITLLILVGREEYDQQLKAVAEMAKETRYWNDKILYIIGMKIAELLADKFNLDYNGDEIDLITIEEALGDKLPSRSLIDKRRKSWVMIDDKTIYTGNQIEKFLAGHDIILEEDRPAIDKHLSRFSGRSAQNGRAKGIVKVVFTWHDVEKVNEGEIIVSPMTGPDFMPAIKKAAAIVTDEGGITCHAAIISRELKKPCVIGTKIATQVLKDGDLVEVDAEKGVIKILKKCR